METHTSTVGTVRIAWLRLSAVAAPAPLAHAPQCRDRARWDTITHMSLVELEDHHDSHWQSMMLGPAAIYSNPWLRCAKRLNPMNFGFIDSSPSEGVKYRVLCHEVSWQRTARIN
eukprot:121473-Rhodomonas_salina.1